MNVDFAIFFFSIAPPLLVVWTQVKYKQSQINGLTHRIWLIITDFFFYLIGVYAL